MAADKRILPRTKIKSENTYYFFLDKLKTNKKSPPLKREIKSAYREGTLNLRQYKELLAKTEKHKEKLPERIPIMEYGKTKVRPIGEIAAKRKKSFLSGIFSHNGARLGFFVLAMFVLLFVVTKDVMANTGQGELLFFALVIIGLLVILTHGSKKVEDFDF